MLSGADRRALLHGAAPAEQVDSLVVTALGRLRDFTARAVAALARTGHVPNPEAIGPHLETHAPMTPEHPANLFRDRPSANHRPC